MERVVNILGLGPSVVNCADTGENWVINVAYKYVKKVDNMFFMDNFDVVMNAHDNIVPEYTFADMIKANPGVELISRKDGEITNVIGQTIAKVKEYPLTEALKLCPGAFFTSTIAYVIAYAIMQKVDRIRMYGFEIWSGANANEYMFERPCVDFWLSYAMGRGIKVEVPYYLILTTANNQNLYGYEKGELKK